MHLDTTMQLAAIRHDELQRDARTRAPSPDRRPRLRARWARRTTQA